MLFHCALLLASAGVVSAVPPNLIFVLADDLGYGVPGWGAPSDSPILTPNLDALRSEGLTLLNNYVYQFCSPSRGSFLTGRFPYKLPQTRCNFLPATIPDCTPVEYSMLPKKLKDAGYISHHVGKWHQGLYKPSCTPIPRGFDTSYGFLTGGEDHLTQAGDVGADCNKTTVYDIWEGNATAPQFQGEYTGYRLNDVAVNHITGHAAKYGKDTPLFMYLALHNTHAPIESMPEFSALYPTIAPPLQKHFYGMVSTVDSTVKNVTAALKATGMWDNTLFVYMTDNGSPIQVAGSNYPLRGGKGSNWEGGVRVPSVVSGGLLPPSQRGKVTSGVAHIVDLYSTFAGLAGVNSSDPVGPEPQIDSLDLWPFFSGATPTSPRDAPGVITVLDHSMYRANVTTGAIIGGGNGRFKLLVGGSFSSGVAPEKGEWDASWFGLFSPNSTFPGTEFYACPPSAPCLFDLAADPTEHTDVSAQFPDVYASMMAEFKALEATYHPSPINPPEDNAGLCAAANSAKARNNGKLYVMPWREG